MTCIKEFINWNSRLPVPNFPPSFYVLCFTFVYVLLYYLHVNHVVHVSLINKWKWWWWWWWRSHSVILSAMSIFRHHFIFCNISVNLTYIRIFPIQLCLIHWTVFNTLPVSLTCILLPTCWCLSTLASHWHQNDSIVQVPTTPCY